MRVEEGRTCFLGLLEALDISCPAKKGTVFAPCSVMITKSSEFTSGLCSGMSPGGRRIKLISLWERSPYHLLSAWTSCPSFTALLNDLPPLFSAPEAHLFPSPAWDMVLTART